MTATTGVLVMAHGTPTRRQDVAAYYTRIRRGRPPSDEQLAELLDRYDAIGGLSPLAERTDAQVRGIAETLEARHPGAFDVRLGTKHTSPSIEETAASFLADGILTVIGLVLAPHFSTLGTGEYLERAAQALAPEATFIAIEQWYDAPGFAELLATRLLEARELLEEAVRDEALVLFTAHALPLRVLEGDVYPAQLAESAQLVADSAGLRGFEVGWQSAGLTPEPWIGPDVLEVIEALPDRGLTAIVVCPIGFVSDHLEVLYDLDIQAQEAARLRGIQLVRTRSLNDDPALVSLLAELVASVTATTEERT
jgi:ferrochelatase